MKSSCSVIHVILCHAVHNIFESRDVTVCVKPFVGLDLILLGQC